MSSAEPEQQPATRRRLVVIGLLVFVFGLPAALAVLVIWFQSGQVFLPLTEQPGGEVRGLVLDPDGKPLEGIAVELSLLTRGADRQTVLLPFVSLATTDAEGRFAAQLPPAEGLYVLRAGGGPWRWEEEQLSHTGMEPATLELTLRPGGIVTAVVEEDGVPRGRGDYRLVRRAEGALGALGQRDVLRGELVDGRLSHGGLAPGTWTLEITLLSGIATFEETFEVPEGGVRRELRFAW